MRSSTQAVLGGGTALCLSFPILLSAFAPSRSSSVLPKSTAFFPPIASLPHPLTAPTQLFLAKDGGGFQGFNVQNSGEGDGNGEDWTPREGEGPNWLEKSSPTGIGGSIRGGESDQASEGKGGIDDYSLGISGVSFDTGPLSRRMFDALTSVAAKRFPAGAEMPTELIDIYRTYSMDLTAKEATKAALKQNGLEMVEDVSETGDSVPSDLSAWGEVEAIQLVDRVTGEDIEGELFESFDETVSVGDWTPGQPFNFVVRNVPAGLRKMELSEMLKQLDPTGELRAEAKAQGNSMPDEEISSLNALAEDGNRRAEVSPREAESEESVFTGGPSKGYSVMDRSDMLLANKNPDGTEARATLMHLMDAMVNHGCIIVDLTDGGTNYKDAITVSDMWTANRNFFDAINSDAESEKSLPAMAVAEGAGSTNAKVGFGSLDEGRMQFLETRIRREDGAILPSEIGNIIGDSGHEAMKSAFEAIASAGKDALRITVAAVSDDYDCFKIASPEPDIPSISGLTFEDAEIAGVSGGDATDLDPAVKASEAAGLLAEDLLDDGKPTVSIDDAGVSMSPHRLCRYLNANRNTKASGQSEIFGAHTDTSFITAVPAAAVSGLEVYDEDAECWFRPELLARKHWENEMEDKGEDPSGSSETIATESGENIVIPWHSRYVVLMPGELMQLVTRNEVPASVHRVVAVTNGKPRLSCPVLLRARAGIKMDVEKYLGSADVASDLLEECNGMSMQEIHDRLQPGYEQ